ncbi:GNAT family N-acetyltransferase/peptidase C39 family protein [Shewanella aestuarii]|uniref:GNAT family N-acetyltransferase n=1 Tax=Shewanella aestuarii TaxID=1028752 RepID=A0A6G9QLJ4_9GAMM|nr:GNAT family N-acetyltransferase/peptidase C39 family protein [Shewanella aestuarii]QIR14935.1 GNAT family N-acetyltransferase [Shewanella aestuarii]
MLFRSATLNDLPQLNRIEHNAFSGDKISARQMKRFINSDLDHLIVADENGTLAGYALILFHRGTRLARLYSIAVSPEFRGRNIAFKLVTQCENIAVEHGFITLRLEVRNDNIAAKNLYLKMGYKVLKTLVHYYDDLADGVRMHKRLDPPGPSVTLNLPLYIQTTDFTCGPSCLLMSFNAFEAVEHNRITELNIWREATTIFMTSGHGGCSARGLAIAAINRGFDVALYSQDEPTPFITSVRDTNKKAIIEMVHQDFKQQLTAKGVSIAQQNPTIEQICEWISAGFPVLIMVSTYRLDGKKSPHWIVLTGFNEHYFFFHDPYVEQIENSINSAFVPISKTDLLHMARYGKQKQIYCLIIRGKQKASS